MPSHQGKQARKAGLLTAPLPAISFHQWQRQICDSWFETNAAFAANITQRKINFPDHIQDTLTMRAIAVFMRYGVTGSFGAKCPVGSCTGNLFIQMRSSGQKWHTYVWSCSKSGHMHMDEPVNCQGVMQRIPINSWMPFLEFINRLRLGERYSRIKCEMEALYGVVSPQSFTKWKTIYQQSLGDALEVTGGLIIGGPSETVVMDETVIGVDKSDGWAFDTKGINKRGPTQMRTCTQRTKKLVKKGVPKRLPARTVYKTQKMKPGTFELCLKASALKATAAWQAMQGPSAKKKPAANKRPAANLKSNGRWLWLAVRVGIGSAVCTHENGMKRIAYRLLPRKSESKDGKPRGLEEIKDTIEAHIAKESLLVHDAWTSTETAVEELGYKHPPGIVHKEGYRDVHTGFHTNDAESENSRLKDASRARYGHLRLTEDELAEYAFYVNIGSSMPNVLRGLAVSGGGPFPTAALR